MPFSPFSKMFCSVMTSVSGCLQEKVLQNYLLPGPNNGIFDAHILVHKQIKFPGDIFSKEALALDCCHL
jgi:hypothetical protein